MPDDVPTANAVINEPKNMLGRLLNNAMLREWFKRQLLKVAAAAAAYVAGWFANQGGQEYAQKIAAGAGALILFGGEFLWSLLQTKTNVSRIVTATELEAAQSPTQAAKLAAKLTTKS